MSDESTILLTPKEAATLLKVTRRTVYTWLRNGTLPSFKIRHMWRIRVEDLDRLTERNDHA